jgi:hypothetical protein
MRTSWYQSYRRRRRERRRAGACGCCGGFRTRNLTQTLAAAHPQAVGQYRMRLLSLKAGRVCTHDKVLLLALHLDLADDSMQTPRRLVVFTKVLSDKGAQKCGLSRACGAEDVAKKDVARYSPFPALALTGPCHAQRRRSRYGGRGWCVRIAEVGEVLESEAMIEECGHANRDGEPLRIPRPHERDSGSSPPLSEPAL